MAAEMKEKRIKHLVTIHIIYYLCRRYENETLLQYYPDAGGFFKESILARAQKKGLAEIDLHNLARLYIR